jgi:Tol biopolymer transport system component
MPGCQTAHKQPAESTDAAGKVARAVAVRTDHGDSPSNISTDEIYIERADGTREYLTRNSLMERCPALSSDNQLLTFIRRRDSDGNGTVDWDDNCELCMMDLVDHSTVIVSEGLADASSATWHPSRHLFSFIAGTPERMKKLYVYDAETAKRRELSDDASAWPTWSLDGTYIAFYDKTNRVTVVDADTGSQKTLSDDVGNGWALYWTYDGRLVFIAEDGDQWFVFTPDTQQVRELRQDKPYDTVDQKIFNWATRGAQPESGRVRK